MLLAQNLPTELQVCPHPETHRVGVFWDQSPGGLAVSQGKILLDGSITGIMVQVEVDGCANHWANIHLWQ